MAIQKIDLNLFRVFEAVMQHRSVSIAAQNLGVTASAVSHALSRLRQAIGDDLFIPGESGMEPTARALELAPNIRDGLGLIASAIGSKTFVPSEAIRTFRIAASDNTAVTILPHLLNRLTKAAPFIDLRVIPVGRLDVVRHLDEGRVDLVLGWFKDLPERMRRAKVMEESEAIVVRAGHPLIKGPITKKSLFDFPHVVVELTGTEEQAVDGFLDDRGVLRRVWIERLLIEKDDDDQDLIGRIAVSVPHFGAVAPLLHVSDMVATLPRRLALQAAKQGSLVVLDLPYEPMIVPIEAVWHQRADMDEGSRWFIGELIEAVKAVDNPRD